jgi:S-adenosylmethionine decarboxylase
LIEFFGCQAAQLDSVTFWKKLLSQAVAASDVTIINKHFYKFTPHGITGYLLLSASHISIHTWPEYAYVTCDVFSCGGRAETEGIVQYITNKLKHERVKIKKVRRGFRVCL